MRAAKTGSGRLVEAAVIVPVYRNNRGESRLILILRAEGGIHGGQLAFPGGKKEKGDLSLLATAVREAKEEIGLIISPETEVIALPVVSTNSTGFMISPFLCGITPPKSWQLSEREIAEVIDLNIDDLRSQEPARRKSGQLYYVVGPHKLWGASFRIIQPLINGGLIVAG